MNQEPEGPPLTRKIRITDIEDGDPITMKLSEEEEAAIAAMLDLVDLKGFAFDYRLRRGGSGRVRLSGRLTADATQTCVVTLEPVAAPIDVPVEIEFWPESQVEDQARKAEEPGQAGLVDWPEAIAGGVIDLGPVAYDALATALDPYPRKEGAHFQWRQGDTSAKAPKTGPFAALEQLKKR